MALVSILPVVHSATAERMGDCALVSDGRLDVGLGTPSPFDSANEGVEPGHAIELLRMSKLRAIEGAPQYRDRFVVDA